MLGSKSAEAIEDMVGYAQETQHEKIQRGIFSQYQLFCYFQVCKMVFDMTGVTRDYVDMDVDYDGVEYTGKEVWHNSYEQTTMQASFSRSSWSMLWVK